VSDIAASDYIGTADAGTSVSFDDDPIDVSVNFGDATGTRRAFLHGLTRTLTHGFGSVAAGTYEEFDLSDVTIQGAADVAGPVVKANFPLKPNTLNKLDITGTATDTEAVTLDAITVNGVATAGASTTIADSDGNGAWAWTVIGLPLKKGANT